MSEESKGFTDNLTLTVGGLFVSFVSSTLRFQKQACFQ